MGNLPQDFKKMISALETIDDRVAGLIDALENSSPSVSVRVNPRKAQPSIIAAGESVPWCTPGYYLSERPVFTLDVAMHQGRYYVQDASSMFIAHVIKELTADDAPLLYLDACAAPGGKTTAAIDALPEGSLVVANEYDYRRAEILSENVAKWGYPSVVVSRGDTSRFQKLQSTFDIIAADVPCSGEGMMRKDAEAVDQWTPSLVEKCVKRQREIVDNLWGALKPGGYFIYSTCTFNRAENEEMVRYIIDTFRAEIVPLKASDLFPQILPALDPTVYGARFMPHLTRGEGLFMAVLKKHGHSSEPFTQKSIKTPKSATSLPPWWPVDLVPLQRNDTLYGVLPQWKGMVDQLLKHLDVITPGVEMATVKGRDFIPSQGAAMLAGYSLKDVARYEVDRDTALTYLRRETITLGDDAPRGFVLLCYESEPLGWVKNLGNRSNNLYPQTWRIRHL